MTPVGFEPTPFRIGALSHRLRALGQSVLICDQILTWMSAIPIDYVISTHTKNILDFSGQAPTRLRPWPVWLSLLQHKLQPYLTLVDAVWLQPRPKVPSDLAASLVPVMPWSAQCRWPIRQPNMFSAMTVMLSGCKQLPGGINDTCGVRAHALSDWRLEPPP